MKNFKGAENLCRNGEKLRRKITAIFVLFLLVVTGLDGCSKREGKETGQTSIKAEEQSENGTKSGNEKPTMGRYMELKIDLPELDGDEGIIKILENTDKQIEVYTMTAGKETNKVNAYRLKEDQTWEKRTPGWLNNDRILTKDRTIQDLCVGRDKNYYAVYADYNNDTVKCGIVKSADGGKTASPVKIPYLEQEISTNDYKHYPNITKIQVLKDGSLVLHDMWDRNYLAVYSPDGKEIDKLQAGADQDDYYLSYITTDTDIITVNEAGTGIVFYNPVLKKAERTADYNNSGSLNAFAMKEDGTLFLGNTQGISRIQKSGTLWETTVDGTLNSMSMPSLSFSGLYVTEGEEEYYAVYGINNGGYELKHYVFDKDVASVPSKEITVYSLKENSTIRQAISLFQAENTDVKINYVVAMGEEAGDVTDYIRALNTELLAGNGADVLVLDGLPIDSYIEKGVLADIKDLINPLEESGDLLTNITGCYEKDGKVYEIPIRFSIPIIAGNKKAIQASGSLTSIVNYIGNHKAKPYFRKSIYNYRLLLENCMALYSEDLFRNNTLNEKNFTVFLKEVKSVSDNINAEETSQDAEFDKKINESLFDNSLLFKGDILSIPREAETAMDQIYDIFSTMLLFEVLKNNEIEYQSINQTFLPRGIVGLNSKAKESDMAKQFIQFLFDSKVQDTDVYDGFPVNLKSLKKMIAEENNNISIGTSDNRGNMISAEWPVKEEREEILNMAQKLNKSINTNSIFNNLVIDEVVSYLKGEIDEGQAVAAVKAKVNTYLAE